MYTAFEWDGQKAASNLKKHGVLFEDAVLAFEDPFALREFDQQKDGEERWRLIGMAAGEVVVTVAHTTKETWEDGVVTEVIRLISARKAQPRERKRYRDGLDSLRS